MRCSLPLPMVALTVQLAVVLPAPAQRAPQLEALDSYVAKGMRDWAVPGLAIAVVRNDSVIFLKGYGVRELGKPDPVDEHTLFAIASTTKAMTAASVGMLVDEGKVKWNDPVTGHLPAFQLSDPYITRELTVRDLLTHRSGLGNTDYLWYGNDVSTAEVLRRVRYARPTSSLRSQFVYQNVMYAVAGEVVASASGVPWARFIQTRIFQPLGMTGSLPTAAERLKQVNMASAHFRIDDTVRVIGGPLVNSVVDPIAPAGAIWSNVADMSKWVRFILDSGRVNGRALLTPATFRELLAPQVIVSPAEFYPTAKLTHPHWTTYGMGWFQEDYAGRAVDFHTGSIDGYVALIGLIPDERLGVYVLANLDHAELRHALMYKVFDLFGPAGSIRDWSADFLKLYAGLRAEGRAAERKLESQRVAGTRPSLPLERYAGNYADSLYGTVSVSYSANALHLRYGTSLVADLEHWHYDSFRVRYSDRWLGKGMATFALDARGMPATLDLDGATFRKSPASPSALSQ